MVAAAVLFAFAGCVRPVPVSHAAVVTFKTPRFKIHDTAFVTLSGRDVAIIVYNAGTPVFEISTGSMVCINGRCLSDDEFITEYLSPHYPSRIISRIVAKEVLEMEGAVLEARTDGFVQQIRVAGKYDIHYRVTPREVFFKDRENNIIIAIREIE
jgi:hypothetical protein